jgi:hypothetical protein
VCINCLGDGLEAVCITGDTDKVGSDKPNNGKHGSTTVTDLGLTEEGDEWTVGFGKTEGVEFEVTSLEVGSADCKITQHRVIVMRLCSKVF